MPVPEDRNSKSLHNEIKALGEMLLKVHYFQEANWLWMASSSPPLCQSEAAQAALRSARVIALELRYPSVASWLDRTVLQPAAGRESAA